MLIQLIFKTLDISELQ